MGCVKQDMENFHFQAFVNNSIFVFFFSENVFFSQLETTWNSKRRSGYNFDQFFKNNFPAFLQLHPEAIHIWLAHQSKALIFYFDMRKKFISDFGNFVGNRQTKFHEFKHKVCEHILNFNLWNSVCLFPIKFTNSATNFFLMSK